MTKKLISAYRLIQGDNFEMFKMVCAYVLPRFGMGGDKTIIVRRRRCVYRPRSVSETEHYISSDWLGSITHIANSSGAVVQELSYDAWGRLRNPSNQGVYSPDAEPSLLLGRGYTGHEHLTQFGLINMNARLYDPAVGRFLSPDPYVQAPNFSQNFKRCTEPDGEFRNLIIGTHRLLHIIIVELCTP
jgi:RHS repeat-associated protein